MDNDKKQLELDLSEEIAQGVYANLTIIAHSSAEFVIDFASLMPGISKPKINTRIVLAPEHAKRLLLALNDNMKKFESQYGEIRIENLTESHPPVTAGEA